MPAYRFCRTDDIGLLVEALNRCWSPYFPDEPPMTPAAFKRSIRDLQVWCSSCMVAFAGADPIAVLIGAKRPSATLVHRIAVHPDHRRQGHGPHLLTSLSSKLAILGPARIVAEVPDALAPACSLFSACGYVQEALLTDYVWERDENDAREPAKERQRVSERSGAMGVPASERVGGSGGAQPPGLPDGQFVIPVSIDDLAANGLLGEGHPQQCWERSVETLIARKDEITGLAVASDERIEAYLLYASRGTGSEAAPTADRRTGAREVEILALRSCIEDEGGARLTQLLARLGGRAGTFRFPKVHHAEIPTPLLETFGFHAAAVHRLFAARAQPD